MTNLQEFLPSGSQGKVSAYNAGYLGSIPGSGRASGEGNGNPLQYSCLENSMDGGAWWAIVCGVTKSWTWLSDFTSLHSQERECLHNNWHYREAISKIQAMRNFGGKMIQSPQKNICKISFIQNFARSILSKRGMEINSLNKSDQKYVNNGNIRISPISRLKNY